MLDCTGEKLRELSAYIRAILAGDYLCTIGNAGQIAEEKGLFQSVRELYS